jgi:hypothetical protein
MEQVMEEETFSVLIGQATFCLEMEWKHYRDTISTEDNKALPMAAHNNASGIIHAMWLCNLTDKQKVILNQIHLFSLDLLRYYVKWRNHG